MEHTEVVIPTDIENRKLADLGETPFSEMSRDQLQFLNALLFRKQPKKILELGVSSGGTSMVILNAIADRPEAQLYSVDLLDMYYRDPSRPVGFVLETRPDLRTKYRLFTGDYSYRFLDEIGTGIDFCVLDTIHCLPGEVLDFLTILPYLADECTLVLHDTNYHLVVGCGQCIAPCLLMSAAKGAKLLASRPYNPAFLTSRQFIYGTPFPSIGGVVVDTKANLATLWDLFNLLTIQWTGAISRAQYEGFRDHFARFYDPYFVNFFDQINNCQYLLRTVTRPAAPGSK